MDALTEDGVLERDAARLARWLAQIRPCDERGGEQPRGAQASGSRTWQDAVKLLARPAPGSEQHLEVSCFL